MNNSLPPTAVAAQTEPNRLGHYELLDCIGRGGMGLVYRARDTRLDRQVAIKCLRTELFEHHYVERFKREALLLAKLNHPNIVQIYDFIEAPDQLALVMELVEGQNLQLHLREHIAPFAQRMRWLTEIAQGLAVAHDAGIIHRDLKAENILINQRKVAKITDLGIAKSQDYNATLTDHVAGSYCSMSPEQAMGEAIDFKSDLFSFGILAYQLLCGAHPFGDTNNKLQLMQRIISHPPTAPSKHNPNLPAEINDLLGQLLSKDPTKRPDNTHWVAAQFEALSHLQLQNEFVSDETQALIPSGAAANQSTIKNTGINSAVRTQDHPTFETRFVAVDSAPKKLHWVTIKNYVADNKISVGLGLFSTLILAAVVIWQLQPKPPKYVAVIPPKLTAEGMQESQQELVKGAVYDAIQQSVIQLEGYYLIPRDEIADVNGDNETVRRATAADELITTEIKCRIETCKIILSRLVPESKKTESRLRIENTKTIDVLTDNYLTVAEVTRKSIEKSYSRKTLNRYENIQEIDYQRFLEAKQSYLTNGASEKILEEIESITHDSPIDEMPTLYRDVALDLHYETAETSYIEKLKNFLHKNNSSSETSNLLNLYYLQIAEKDFESIKKTITAINKTESNEALALFLDAHLAQSQNNYELAIHKYDRLIKLKPTAINYQNIAIAHWYAGKLNEAKENLTEAIKQAPKSYKTNQIYGAIALSEGNTDKAIDSFETIVKQRKNATDLSNLGVAYLLANKPEEAAQHLLNAHQLAPQNIVILLNLADAESLSNKLENAHNKYKLITSKVDDNTPKHEELRSKILAHAHLGNFSTAISLLKRLHKLDDQNIDTIYTAAIVYTLAGEKISALTNIEDAFNKKISHRWFNFSWFNHLCNERKFIDLMKKNGAPERCPVS